MTAWRPDDQDADFEIFLDCYRDEHWTASKVCNFLACGVQLVKPRLQGPTWFASLIGDRNFLLQCEHQSRLLDLATRYSFASKASLDPALDPRKCHFRDHHGILQRAPYLGSWLRLIEHSLSDVIRVAYFSELGYWFPTSPHNKALRTEREFLLAEAEAFQAQFGPDPRRGPLPPLALDLTRKEAHVVVLDPEVSELLSAHKWGNTFFGGRASLHSAWQLRASLAALFPHVHVWTELEAEILQQSARLPPVQLTRTRKQGLFGRAEPY